MAEKITFIPFRARPNITATADADTPVTYWSNPTEADCAFGYGATHYREFELKDVVKKDGTIKRWLKDGNGRRWNYSCVAIQLQEGDGERRVLKDSSRNL